MKNQKEHITLKFSCQEDLTSMPTTKKGSFCSSCKKEVIDCTKMSYLDIQRLRTNESEPCGIFLPQQVDSTLHPIEFQKTRSFAFLTTIFLSLSFGTANAQSTVDPKTEQSHGSSNAPNLTPQEAKEKSESGQHISMSKACTEEAKSEILPTKIKHKRARRYKKWFWSKRFPFLHRRRRFVAGKF